MTQLDLFTVGRITQLTDDRPAWTPPPAQRKVVEPSDSQSDEILRYLREGHTLTPMDALRLFGCFRLGARVYDLKRRGYDIKSKMVDTDNGKRVAQYSL